MCGGRYCECHRSVRSPFAMMTASRSVPAFTEIV
jgi:hypothetical protein